MNRALTKEQKRNVCMAAARAWKALPQARRDHFLRADGGMSASAAQELWRHYEQGVATGRALSLVETPNSDYCLLMSHFEALAGNARGSQYWRQRRKTDANRQVLWLIKCACGKEYAFPQDPDEICCDRYGHGIYAATAHELEQILYTVKNRVKMRRAQSS